MTLESSVQTTQLHSTRLSVPVAVVLEKRLVKGKFWTESNWRLDSVLSGEHLALSKATDGIKTADTESGELFLWSGYQITLYRDACERYWHALIGDRPRVYVVCREDETDGSIEPAVVTLDYDEASAHSETDGQVLSADIPKELYQLMETFVLDHYKPAEFKKRKRKKWTDKGPADGEPVRD